MKYRQAALGHLGNLSPENGVNRPICARFDTFARSAGSGTRDAILPCIFAKVKNGVPVTCLPDQDSSRALTTAAAQPFEEGQNRTKGRIRPKRRYSAPTSALQNRTCMVISIGGYERNFAIPLLRPLIS